MKKRNKILAIVFSIPLIASCLAADFPSLTGWMSLHISPLETEENQAVTFVYRVSSLRGGEVVHFNVFLQNQQFPIPLLIFQDYANVDMGISDLQRVVVLDGGLLSEGPNNISFEATMNKITKSISVDAFYKTKAVVRPGQDNLTEYASPHNDITLSSGILTKKRDYFCFYGFNPIIENEYYHHLDLNNLFFTSENIFSYSTAVLRIKDDYGYYSRLDRGIAIGYRDVALQIYNDGEDHYHFTYGVNLYVDPDTLLMSLSSRDGFVATNTFYFPKEKYETEKDLEMSIVINNCGINESTIIYDFTNFSYLRFIGNCRDSMYCVSTSTCQDETVFEEWEMITL